MALNNCINIFTHSWQANESKLGTKSKDWLCYCSVGENLLSPTGKVPSWNSWCACPSSVLNGHLIDGGRENKLFYTYIHIHTHTIYIFIYYMNRDYHCVLHDI